MGESLRKIRKATSFHLVESCERRATGRFQIFRAHLRLAFRKEVKAGDNGSDAIVSV